MTTDATPAALRLIDQLGPLPDCYSRYKHEVGMPLYSADQMRAYAAQEVAAERERCAKICESMHDADLRSDYAWAIRTEWAADSEGPNAEVTGRQRLHGVGN